MFKRHANTERQYWFHAKARGRRKFIWREGLLFALVLWLVLVPALALFGDHPFSAHRTVFIGLILLPLFLLWRCLNGIWRWKDLDKKYPE